MNIFKWADFHKDRAGIKIHTMFDVERQIPTFFHISNARIHDVKLLKENPIETASYYVFDRGYNDFKQLHRIHESKAYFVIRAKRKLNFNVIREYENRSANILWEAKIQFAGIKSLEKYPETLRIIRFWDEEQNRSFDFLTNAKNISAEKVALLYKNRWQVELFFKWLKQHLKIKKFWGNSENAVRIQIYTAITAYCLIAIIQRELQIKHSTYEILQILSVSLTDTSELKQLLEYYEDESLCKNENFGQMQLDLF